jgi:hypothetical protein
MNERIQELIKQASYNIMETNGAPIISNEFNKEKFAELIIREYEQFLPEICPWANADEKGPMKGWHVQFVARKHFGME